MINDKLLIICGVLALCSLLTNGLVFICFFCCCYFLTPHMLCESSIVLKLSGEKKLLKIYEKGK